MFELASGAQDDGVALQNLDRVAEAAGMDSLVRFGGAARAVAIEVVERDLDAVIGRGDLSTQRPVRSPMPFSRISRLKLGPSSVRSIIGATVSSWVTIVTSLPWSASTSAMLEAMK